MTAIVESEELSGDAVADEVLVAEAEIGERIGMSQMHVSRLIRQAISQLRATTPRE